MIPKAPIVRSKKPASGATRTPISPTSPMITSTHDLMPLKSIRVVVTVQQNSGLRLSETQRKYQKIAVLARSFPREWMPVKPIFTARKELADGCSINK
jgi:hypothetical protein